MAKRFETQEERDAFLAEPRLAILMYHSKNPNLVGVPVWFEWDGEEVQMFAARNSAKVKRLQANPAASVLVTNRVGEPEGWVAFDGEVQIDDFEPETWVSLIDRIAPRYWDMSVEGYANEIANWRASPESFISMVLKPARIRSGR